MYQYLTDSQKKKLLTVVLGAFAILTIFLAIKTINSIKEFSYIGKGVYPANVITVNGTGEAYAVPDVATFSFSVVESSKLMPDALDKASKKMNSVIDALKALGVDEKDIKTTNYSSYPKYDYSSPICPKYAPMPAEAGTVSTDSAIYCPPGKNVLTGYEINQTITVKVRKVADAGNILAKVGSLNVSNISGIDFVVDNPDKVQAEARDEAIKNAKDKAAELAKSLGVNLSHITGFYENGVQPYYGYADSGMISAKAMGSVPTAPQLPTGENKYTSSVSITYEVK